jgi:hypothetical protein
MLWTYSRPDRLDHLKRRAFDQVVYLERSRCDCRTAGQRVALDRRLTITRGRARRFSMLARTARHNALVNA